MNHELIQQIEQAVEKVLRGQSLPRRPAVLDKQLLAIFDSAQVSLELPLQQLDKCIRSGYVVKAILSDLAAKVLDIDCIKSTCGAENVLVCTEIIRLQSFMDDFSTLLIPVLSYPMAARLALGLVDTPCTYLIFQAILQGNVVIATSDLGEETEEIQRASALLQLGRDYAKTLSKCGIQFVRAEDIAQVVLSCNVSSSFYAADTGHAQTVISASVIAALAPTVRELVYNNPSIVTPLARDLAYEKGIELVAKTK